MGAAACAKPASKIRSVNNIASANSIAEWPVFTYISQQKVAPALLEDCTGNGGCQLEQAEFIFASSTKKRSAEKLITWVCTWHLKSVWAHVGVILTSALLGKLSQGGQGPSLLLLYLCNLTSYGIKLGIQQALSRCLLSEQRNNAQGNECPTSKKYPLSSDNFYQDDGSDTIWRWLITKNQYLIMNAFWTARSKPSLYLIYINFS